MLRRIVLLKTQDALIKGWQERSFAASAIGFAPSMKSAGVHLEESIYPTPVFGRRSPNHPVAKKIRYGSRLQLGTPSETPYAVVAHFEDQEAIQRLKTDKAEDVVGVYADVKIEIAPAYCNAMAVGNYKDVVKALPMAKVHAAGITGKKVRVAVVDTGIHGLHPAADGKPIQQHISGGYSPIGGYRPGSAAINHGTMVAFDTLLAAPDAVLLDYALLQATADSWSSFLSDAIAAFADLIDLLTKKPGPLVVNNSWGLFDRSTDAPVGSPENYSANPNHPFNQIVGSLVASGADVLFAAGNCGQECPDGRCGAGDTGRGASIHGANSHPAVITIAAVTVKKERLGYSSQGPGGLTDKKPDLAAYSHFVGSGVYKADGGTSAACPVAAGVIAALRQAAPKITPGQLKGLLQTSTDLIGGAWDYDTGYGVINAEKAWSGLSKESASGAAPGKASKKKFANAWMLEPNTPEAVATHAENLRKASTARVAKAAPKKSAAKKKRAMKRGTR